ncbi:hypothetical protein AQ727_22530 [Burkholderia pseudomallei]|nr:hypothetical protein AQ717_03765 [Burkholderia pseudomallei]OMR69908.1 hypothetical protein AQ727_22530 [Burkholderia pseudomallei]
MRKPLDINHSIRRPDSGNRARTDSRECFCHGRTIHVASLHADDNVDTIILPAHVYDASDPAYRRGRHRSRLRPCLMLAKCIINQICRIANRAVHMLIDESTKQRRDVLAQSIVR